MHYGWNGTKTNTDRQFTRFEVGNGGSGAVIDYQLEPNLPQGSWAYGEGTVHHCAFEVADLDVQRNVKLHLEGLGYTDVSDRKDRGYFDSVYVRTPSGALFEATVSKPAGFTVDEPFESLGKSIQIPPQLGARAQEIIAYLEPLKY
jgi:glyoxalase family protein